MSGPDGMAARIAEALLPHGLHLRGIASFPLGDGPHLAEGKTAQCVVLIGNAGGSMWSAFCQWRGGQPDGGGRDPLDRWSKEIISPIATEFGASAYFPSDPPYQPFQQWAVRAEGLRASPLGILIHPVFGLWHGYRGALGFAMPIGGAEPPAAADICGSCREKPCLSTCPAMAVGRDGFDVARCRDHLVSTAGQAGCMTRGCLARDACPVGRSYRYPEEQIRFHMKALDLSSG